MAKDGRYCKDGNALRLRHNSAIINFYSVEVIGVVSNGAHLKIILDAAAIFVSPTASPSAIGESSDIILARARAPSRSTLSPGV